MARRRTLIIVLCIAALAAIVALTQNFDGVWPSSQSTVDVMIKGERFRLELAADAKAREQGLMGRTSIPDDGGMLFVFPDNLVGIQEFWMMNCPIDIDILFLDRQGFVTATHAMKAVERLPGESDANYQTRARERMYSSFLPAQFAIELKAGTVNRLKVKVEDHIHLDLNRLKALARKADQP